ncbi:hypothetical protein F4813DRAFT_380457 [Daldinia decipiens]|uniref:uncharacterized protein n=1 Tax=Daldinia decipiens TaxID=326647 RepID=UPI0020C340A1|nr:uncharacterized protein F4813DRAFT_380457 [Daldinia decipiens]KAI1658101.1 hypothetical protein F4813DRAFT_380457 [Daldinia decipiens]
MPPQNSSGRLNLPGFGLPIDYEPDHDKSTSCFLHALWDKKYFKSVGLTLREIRMMGFINQISDKPNWEEKVFDETIVAKWKEEAKMASHQNFDGDVYLSDKMFENCIKELRDKAKQVKKTGIVNVLDAELAVAKSDTIVPSSLVDDLRLGIKSLEDVPDKDKDWHPGSGEQVLDLLHPSLFPLVYGTTRVLPYGKVPLEDCASIIGEGETTRLVGKKAANEPSLWGSTQWLPSDIAWTKTGPRISSYINNLHPVDHKDLYEVFEKFISAAVPLWEECLFRESALKPRIICEPEGPKDYYLPEGVTVPDRLLQNLENEPRNARDRYELDRYDRYVEEFEEWYEGHKVLRWPEPKDYTPRERDSPGKPDLKKDFPSGLQVIFKLANIHLTPEDPEYDGGSWHIEGALNERIVATALYYYDAENISESRLAFKQAVDAEKVRETPPQYEFQSLMRWMGIVDDHDDPPFQELGSVLTQPGRLLAFPNVFQHQVQPFRLEDPTKPGLRKILAMFLVDPNIRVLSTGVVPPQRRDWWAPEVRKISPFSKIPVEIFDMIIDFVEDFPMSWERAEEVREVLMDERSWTNDKWEEKMSEVQPLLFCEH